MSWPVGCNLGWRKRRRHTNNKQLQRGKRRRKRNSKKGCRKKQEKEQLKAEKAEQKRLAKEQKKAEKAAAKKHKGEEVQEKVEESKGQKRLHEDCTMDGNVPCETAAPDNGHFKTKGLKRAVTSKRTKRKLLTLRRGSLAKKKKTTVKSHAPKKAKRSAAGSIASAAATSTAEKNTEEPYQGTKQQEEPYCESILPSAGSASKQGNPVLQHKTQQKKQKQTWSQNSIESKQASKQSPAAKTNKKKLNQSHARKSSSLYNKCFWIARQQIVCTPPGKLWLLMQRHTSLACIGHARLLAWKCQRPFCRASLQARGAKRQKANAIGPRCNTFRARQVVFTQTCSWPTNLFLDAGLFKFLIWFATIN